MCIRDSLGLSPKAGRAIAEHVDILSSYPDREYTSLRNLSLIHIFGMEYHDRLAGITVKGEVQIIHAHITVLQCKKQIIQTVSYTHLDVYKRQL